LYIESSTWTYENTDLFNFENVNNSKNSITTKNNGYLIRQKDKVGFILYNKFTLSSVTLSSSKICHIEIDNNNNFYLENEIDNHSYILENEPFIIINNFIYQQTNNLGFQLNKGDIIKIGRYRFKIRAINFVNNLNKENINNLNNNINNNNNNLCRICFSNSNFSPLISPCNCTGSMKYIHLSCLQKWLLSKKQYTTKNKFDFIFYIYTTEQIQCELCKVYFPDFYKINGILYDIYDFNNEFTENGQKSSFTIETLLSEKNTEIFIYNIVFTNIGKLGLLNEQNENNLINIKIGRNNNCDIILDDPTISRIHSILNINYNGIYLKDFGSKYGTGVLIQNKRFNFKDEKAISIQFGRTVISFFQKPNLIINLLCCKFKSDEESYSEEEKKGIKFEHGYQVKNE
jgi:pSer/pThr/pTyr-binding forkhead associated (FHA) protein